MQDAITYAIQIAEALQEAHSHGIVHRDIKADNIMVNSKNQVKVMDFGLAKLKGSLKLTKTSSTIGTLAYMAPEQIEGERGRCTVRHLLVRDCAVRNADRASPVPGGARSGNGVFHRERGAGTSAALCPRGSIRIASHT